jgi:hypothetical protein
MRLFKRLFFIPCLLLFNFLSAQNYQAINGSPYAGSLAASSNPASIVHVPYTWDITPLAVQLKQTTNAFIISNFSLLSKPGNAEIAATNGTSKKFIFANQDIRLLNTRVSLNSKASIAFGGNIRNYLFAKTSTANYQDTMYSLADFMKVNVDHKPLSAEAVSTTWTELYASYAQKVFDDGDRVLNAGVTLKYNHAIAGEYGKTGDINYVPNIIAGVPGYLATTGSLQYGYSNNFDRLDSNNTGQANKKAFLQNSKTGFSLDMGVEYIRLADEDNEAAGEFAYETKIGIALMDIGRNKFTQGINSIIASGIKTGITDTVLEHKFSSTTSIEDFNDSLATIASTYNHLTGPFNIYQPARIVVNVDQHIRDNFFINAELTLPVLSLLPKKLRYIKDMNLLAITPRWELKSVGVYMPILVNNQKQVWVGGAFKLGPILLGTHNLANLFSKNKIQTGGGYLALTIRPGKGHDKKAHTPGKLLPDKQSRTVECPKF